MNHAAPSRAAERKALATAEAKLALIRELHRPSGIYDQCACPSDDETGLVRHEVATVTDCGDYETCLPPVYLVCTHCCRAGEDGGQSEACAASHEHDPDTPSCPTMAILDGP